VQNYKVTDRPTERASEAGHEAATHVNCSTWLKVRARAHWCVIMHSTSYKRSYATEHTCYTFVTTRRATNAYLLWASYVNTISKLSCSHLQTTRMSSKMPS